MEEHSVTMIINEDGSLKDYESWKALIDNQVASQLEIMYVDDKLELSRLNGIIDHFIKIHVDMETFINESKLIIDERYIA